MVGAQLATRQWLQRQFQTSGIQIESAALTELAKTVEVTSNAEEMLSSLLDEIESNTKDGRRLTLDILTKFLEKSKGDVFGEVEVIDAFQTPFFQYDAIRKMFYRNPNERKTIGDAKNKVQHLVDRFLLIQQRLRRNSLFRPLKWSGMSNSQHDVAELTELKSLLGLQGEQKFVTGFLTKHEEGQYFIEDLSARLPVDLSACDTADGLFTENCVVVAEGSLQPGGEFRASALGLPPAESRDESLAALQGLDLFSGSSMAGKDQRTGVDDGDRVVFVSDVHLDNPKVFDNLAKIFDGFTSMASAPSVFILFGNFQSYNANHPQTKLQKVKEGFGNLGRLISRYSDIRAQSQFVLIPGPNDVGPANMLPRPGIPKSVAKGLLDEVPNVTLGSNPCRLRFKGSDLVLFRADLQHKLRGLCILPPPSPIPGASHEETASFFFDQVCSTVIQESHLCPIPLEYQPIAWEWDHSLWVYPNPHGLVIADSEPTARSIFDTCDCLNPGSLSKGTFGAWNPGLREMEMCDVSIVEEGVDQEEDEIVIDTEELPQEEDAVQLYDGTSEH